jgi:hypothetical protein
MKFRNSLLNYTVLFFVFCAIDCATSVKPSNSRETNWLKICEGDKQCDEGMRCLCGVCSAECESTEACEALDEHSVCAVASRVSIADGCQGESNASSVGICVLPCKIDRDCAKVSDTELKCQSNYCVDVRYDAKPDQPSIDGGMLEDGEPNDAEIVVSSGEPCERDDDCSGTQVCNARGECEPPLDAGIDADSVIDTGTDSLRPPCDEEGLCEGELVCHLDNTCIERGVFDENGFATLALVPGQIEYIAVDDAYVYWTQLGTQDVLGNYQDDGAVMRTPIEGGPITAIAEFQYHPAHIIVDETYVYWANYGLDYGEGKEIVSARKDGSVLPQAITEDIEYFGSLTQDDDYLYFLDADLGPRRLRKDGTGEIELLADDLTPTSDYGVYSLVVGDDSIYLGYIGGILRVLLDSKEHSVFVDNSVNMEDDAIVYSDKGYLFYSVFRDSQVNRIPADGGRSIIVLDTGDPREHYFQKLAVFDYYLYYSIHRHDGFIEIGRAPMEPGESEVIVSVDASDDTFGLSVDLEVTDKGLFWSQFGEAIPPGRINRYDRTVTLSR